MKKAAVVMLGMMLLSAGCSKQVQPVLPNISTQSGNVASLILDQAARRGGQPNTNGISPLQADWKCVRSNNVQIIIFVQGDHFQEIHTLMGHAFGEPDPKIPGSFPVRLVSGSLAAHYSFQQLGISIDFIGFSNMTYVGIMGSLKK